MYDRRTRAARTADRAAALARTDAFVALRAAEIAAASPAPAGDPAAALAELEAALSSLLATPTPVVTARDPDSVLAELQAGLFAAFASDPAHLAAY